MTRAQCTHCGSQEVRLIIHRTAEGMLDDEGNLESATDTETIVEMTCRDCDTELPLSMIKSWF